MKKSSLAIAFVACALAGTARAAETPAAQLIKVQSEDEGRTSGDFISATDSLNTFYRFQVEVTPDVTTLDVDLFDADIGGGGSGGGNNEEGGTSGRDRDRGDGYASTVVYTLRRPNGTALTTLTCTTTCGGAAADAIWTDFASFSGEFVLDQFGAAAYNNNNGTVNWAGNWAEVNDDGAAGSGQVLITGNELRVTPANALRGAQRTANLTGFGTATLTFTNRSVFAEAGDQWIAQVSSTGGAPYTTLATYSGTFGATARSYDISAFISATTLVRFVRSGQYDDGGGADAERFFVDDVRIQGSDVVNGHWQLDVDMTTGTTDNDINGFGIRTTGSLPASTDLNVYAANMIQHGTNDANNNTFTWYPWVTSGCKCKLNNFDFDSVGSLSVTAADGTAFGPFGTSVNNDWATIEPGFTSGTAPTGGWTNSFDADGYGVFTLSGTIPSYGGSVANYGLFYLSNETSTSASTTDPTSRAPAGSFRLYMPADGAASAPVKPRLEQFLRYTTALPGANPPTAGQTSRYEVTVRLTNPTAYALTAGTGSATIPASATFVAGSIQTTAGTTAIESAGTITWTIGTVPAGATVLLGYRVDISGTGLPRNASGTVTSGGTTVSYTDETGTVTDTLGPLCELSVRTAVITDALIASFDAIKGGTGVTVVWTTSSEAGAAGFNVLREEGGSWTRIGDRTIPALYSGGAGGNYSLADPGAHFGRSTWAIDEITLDGRTIRHGPWSAVPRPQQAADPAGGTFISTPASSDRPKTRPKGTSTATSSSVIVKVDHAGLHAIRASSIAQILGMNQGTVEALVRNGGLSLTSQGRAVAWQPSASGDAILFYGEPADSIYTSTNSYRLTKARGQLMTSGQVAPGGAGGMVSFPHSIHLEQDVFAATAIPLDAEGDYWFWKSLVAGFPGYSSASVTFDATSLASSSGATVRVNLQSWSATPNRARVYLNGTQIGEHDWTGMTAASIQLDLPDGVLRASANLLEVEAVTLPDTSISGFYIDSVDLSYAREFRADSGSLAFTAPAGASVTGFGDASILLLDVTSPIRPVVIYGSAVEPAGDGSWRLSIGAAPGRRLFAAAQSAITPAAVRPDRSEGLASSKNSASYLVITGSGLRATAERFADYRRADGFDVKVVDVESIYDEFSDAMETPHAIRAMLAASRSWGRAPSYVLLAGGGSFDYRGNTWEQPIVPPFMITTPGGIFASDSRYADIDGDGTLDLSIGRIPAETEEELLTYLARVRQIEAASASPSALFASDDPDAGVSFEAAANAIASIVREQDKQFVTLGQEPLATSRSRFMASWDLAPSFVHWTGHGGFDRLASEGLLTTADVASLSGNTSALVALTCIINRFELPAHTSLGEELLLSSAGGAGAVWAPTGLAAHDASSEAGTAFYQALARGFFRVGDAARFASSTTGDSSGLFVLLGDPALQIRLTGEASNPPTGTPE